MQVLYEDNHLLAISKPPGLATQGAAIGRDSVVAWARQYLKERYDKPGNVYVGVVSRLDAAASGVVLLARTSRAAGRLAGQFRERQVKKTYWALVQGNPPSAGSCEDWLAPDEPRRRMQIAAVRAPEAQLARLHFRRRGSIPGGAWLEIELETGRKHQIRLQLAHRGWPILGDRKYGCRRPFSDGIALHARRLIVEHPVRHEPLELVAPPPETWRGAGLGGAW
jgi:23S rRNA pseudouridine1911/1915/1917 synthase